MRTMKLEMVIEDDYSKNASIGIIANEIRSEVERTRERLENIYPSLSVLGYSIHIGKYEEDQ